MHTPPTGNGYVRIALVGPPIFLHWTSPALGVTAGVFALATAGRLAGPVFLWTTSAFMLLVVIHEFGHAAAAWLLGAKVEGIVLAGTGGWCLTSPSKPLAPLETVALYSGGLLAQAIILIATVVALYVYGAPSYLPLNCTVIVFTVWNVVLFVANAVPRSSNDGEMIYEALVQLRRRDA